jgi:hypothetical protein
LRDQLIKDTKVYYNKVVLIFEGIDYFVDESKGEEANVAFWLPRFFPENIRVIVTADRNSKALSYFQ